ncbi:hypothetical protein FOB58_000560 [Candida parapsilosis]|uniref:Uncharacterized protein n=2 Tax=Candida parapsilosis TaxID=5480 RepID=G8BD66_CANPC|nr:uncharacterized protein CPAR2_208560 [Candida parapsilosis]KAF6054638.1 hypothetical protein FOB58_000560 [Candida parapsilosis]KAF6056336.1 hypothetical protein FOB59_000848 [Candida parapsilosis]KAF6059269.1 hypothetical protein FOB60_000851 [Candida parapsilosis]KAF6068026.1 hypothetical protein FOB61_000851 [Candida parapsilosis]KAI5905292.1 hypothetical protein K4G60_g4551 [Candida parapsilosis]
MSLSQSSDNEDAGNASFVEDVQPITTNTKDLEQLSLEELNQYQNKISQEFKILSKDYLNKRLSRINVMLDKLTSSIKLANANEKSWLKIYTFEIEAINNIMTNTEDLIMVNNKTIPPKTDLLKSMDEYEEELQEIFTNLQSPFDFDDTFKYDNGEICHSLANTHSHLSKLPFPFLFNQSFKPHRDELKSISLEKDYQSELIQKNCTNNSTIVWKQYYGKLNQHKNKLLNETQSKLNQLYKDYHHLNQSKNEELLDRYYYRSLISPQYLLDTINDKINITNTDNLGEVMRTNHDSNYVELDTRLNPKNKIELSNIRLKDASNEQFLANTHGAIKRRYSQAFKYDPSVSHSINQSKVDDDLRLIRRKIRHQNEKKRKGTTADENDDVYNRTLHDYSEDDRENDDSDNSNNNNNNNNNGNDIGIGIGNDNKDEYEVVLEDYDPEEEMTPTELEERKIYKNVLGRHDPNASKFRMLELPPLENFPKL